MSANRGALFALAGLVSLVSLGCGDGSNDPKAPDRSTGAGLSLAITSSDLAVGSQRFAFVALQDDKPVVGDPMFVRFFRVPAQGQPVLVGQAEIPWSPLGIADTKEDHTSGSGHIDTDITGVYFANVEFDTPGTWGVGVTRGKQPDVKNEARVSFEVRSKTQTLAIGAKAIPVDNPTLKNASLKQIDTSPQPDEAFHRLSIAEAIRAGKPSVIAFATPSFCVSRTCGPAMQVVGAAAKKYGDRINVAHIEPYELDASGNLIQTTPDERKNVEAANLWRLPTEPWVFVVDAGGTVVARFDGPFGLEELDFYLAQLTT